MKFAKYVLSGVCLSIINSGNVWAVYAGEDPEVAQLKEQVKKLEGQISEMKETDKQFDARTQGIEEKLKDQKDEFLATRDSLKNEIDEAKKGSETVGDLKAKVEQLAGAQATSNEKIEALETSVNSQAPSDSEASGQDVVELNQAVSKLHEELEAQKELNAQQNLEAAKNAAEIDKLKKKDNTSSKLGAVGGFIGNLAKGGLGLLSSKLNDENSGSTSEVYSSVFKSGMNLLSQKLNTNDIKDKLANRQSTAEITKEMNEAEKNEFQSIVQDIQTGKSDEEVQEKLNKLKEKIATRKTEEVISEVEKSKFQKRAFYGLNSAFDSSNLGETVTKVYELSAGASEAPKAENILSGNISSTDQDAVNAIYDMVSKGATLNDIFDCISFHTEGVPMQVERKDVPKDGMVNTLISMAVTEAEQKNHSSDGQSSQPISADNAETTTGMEAMAEQGIAANGLQPGMSDAVGTEMTDTQAPMMNDNGEIVGETAPMPEAVAGTAEDMNAMAEQGVVAGGVQPGMSDAVGAEMTDAQTPVMNANGEIVGETAPMPEAVAGTTADMGAMAEQGVAADGLQPGMSDAVGAEMVDAQTPVMNADGEIVGETTPMQEAVAGTTADMDAMAEQGVAADGLQPGMSDEVGAEMTDAQTPMMNANGEMVDETAPMPEAVAGTAEDIVAMTEQGVAANGLQSGMSDAVGAEMRDAQTPVMNANGEMIGETTPMPEVATGTTADMEAMAEQGVAADGLQPGMSDEVATGMTDAQTPVINADGEIVGETAPMPEVVAGTTADMDAMAEQGVASEGQNDAVGLTGSPNITTDYNEMVPNSYLRDPMSVSNDQQHITENGAGSPTAPRDELA